MQGSPSPEALLAFHRVRAYNVQAYSIISWFGALLAGGIVMQSVDYMQGVSQDARYLKLMVVLTTLAQVVSSTFEVVGHSIQMDAALEDKVESVVLVPWTQSPVALCTLISGLLSQLYFGRLVYRLCATSRSGQRRRLPQLIFLVVFALPFIASAFGGLGVAVCFLQIEERFYIKERALIEFMGTPVMLYATWLTSTAVLDLTLSAMLIFRFLRDVRKDGFDATNSLLTSLAVLTLETFSLTATLALADLGCALLASYSYGAVIPKLELACYALTILVERSYAASFIFTLKRHAQVRSRGLTGGSGGGANKSSSCVVPRRNAGVGLANSSTRGRHETSVPTVASPDSSIIIIGTPGRRHEGDVSGRTLLSGTEPYEEDVPLEILKGPNGLPYAVEAGAEIFHVSRGTIRVDVEQTRSWDRMSGEGR